MELFYDKKPGYDKLDKKACMDYAEGYKAFLDEGKTERDAVDAIVRMAEAKGYKAYVRGRRSIPATSSTRSTGTRASFWRTSARLRCPTACV